MKIEIAKTVFDIPSISDLNRYRYSAFEVDESRVPFATISLTKELLDDVSLLPGVETPSDAEAAAIRRECASMLTYNGKMIFHGAALVYRGNGYVFTGNSGVGKSTQLKNWLSCFPDEISVINGDKPVLGIENRRVYVYPTPWNGKEGMCSGMSAPLCGIIYLEQADVDEITVMSDAEHVLATFMQAFLPTRDKSEVDRVKGLIEAVCDVPYVKLRNVGNFSSAFLLKNYLDDNGGFMPCIS